MTTFGVSSDARPLVRGSLTDALVEILRASLVGLAGGFIIYAAGDLAFRYAIRFLALVAFVLPLVITSGWLAFSFYRKASWQARRVWASIGMGIGMVMLLPTGYLGFELARYVIVGCFGLPFD